MKNSLFKIAYVLIVACLLSCDKSEPNKNSFLDQDLVAHYTFANGQANDLSDNGNDCVISGAVSAIDNINRSNHSLEFNSEDDYVKVNTPSFLNNNTGTFAAWVKFDAFNHTQYVASVGDENSIENYISFIRIGTDQLVSIYQREAGLANWVKGTTLLQANQYYHFVMTSDGSTRKIYINGQEEALSVVNGTNNGKWISDLASIDNFVIGSSIIQTPYTIPYLTGKIDEVRLYNRAFSEAEILSLYNLTN